MDKILDYIGQLNSEYELYMDTVCEKYDSETIHDLRVTIKKIRAALRLMAKLNPDFNAKKAIALYKPGFQKLGKIRDLQLQQIKFSELSQQYGFDFSDYLYHLQSEEQLAKIAFSSYYENFDYRNFHRFEYFNDFKITVTTSRKIVRQQLTYYQNFLKSWSFNSLVMAEELHDLRKKVKDVQYNLSFMESCVFGKTLPKEYHVQFKAFTEKLGNWHDNFILLLHLYDYKLNFVQISKHQLTRVNQFERKILSLNASKLKLINSGLNNFKTLNANIISYWK